MSNGVPSQISLENAVVAQDEMGRPFIIVREYSSPLLPHLTALLTICKVRDEKGGKVFLEPQGW